MKKKVSLQEFCCKQKALADNSCEAFFCSLQALAPMGRAAKLFQVCELKPQTWNGAGFSLRNPEKRVGNQLLLKNIILKVYFSRIFMISPMYIV